jgi:hypothetical protein
MSMVLGQFECMVLWGFVVGSRDNSEHDTFVYILYLWRYGNDV